MEKLINRILWKRKNRGELILAAVGFLLGLVMFLLCIQLYTDIDYIFNSRLSLEKQLDYIIISKRVSAANMLLGSPGFSADEIANIRDRDFTLDLGIIKANEFAASAGVGIGGKGFVTELFFEAVPDSFLDFIPGEWDWQEEHSTIPVMISRDFLMLYNFGFSQARGFPMVSEETIKLLPMNVTIAGQGKRKEFRAKIVGLSDRIASILVPYTFMKWANKHYGQGKPLLPARLMISVKDRSDPEIIHFIEQNDYETSKEKLRLSDAGFTIKIVLTVIAVIGIFLILLSFIIFLSTFKLAITRSGKEIKLLIDLGYTKHKLVKNLVVVLTVVMGCILGASAVIFLAVVIPFHGFLNSNGFTIPRIFTPVVPVTGMLFVAVTLALNYLSISRYMERSYRKN